MDEFDRLIEDIERKISEKERALYSAKVIAHAHDPKNLTRMDQAHAFAVVRGWCGDTMEIYLRLDENGRITVLMDDPNHLTKRDMVRSLLKKEQIDRMYAE